VRLFLSLYRRLLCSSFVKWLNSAKTQALFYEEPECAGSEPYARATTSAVTIDHAAGTIHVAQNGADTQRVQAHTLLGFLFAVVNKNRAKQH
jgi:hypothetical protein